MSAYETGSGIQNWMVRLTGATGEQEVPVQGGGLQVGVKQLAAGCYLDAITAKNNLRLLF